MESKTTSSSTRVRRIMKDIDRLNDMDRQDVLSRIVLMLKKTNVKNRSHLTDLKGLGKELWTNRDIDAYIANERDAWD
ncbi:MAG: hypothetical protein LBL42_06825 [Tannerella sp.]|jgi:hypothetical protein|nr:hypothetical protein [Tannerella sp.]